MLLFDIDGTLIVSGGAGGTALELALLEQVGLAAALAEVSLEGSTDLAIVREALSRANQPVSAALVERILARYFELLPAALVAAEGYRVLAGVAELLEALQLQQRSFGLCTGNMRSSARHKLEHGGLWARFANGFGGGFGDDGELRADIVRAALRRAEISLGQPLRPDQAIVIGDTPRDVAAARAVGVPVLAVASGRSSLDDLRAAGADWVAERLSDPQVWRQLEVEA